MAVASVRVSAVGHRPDPGHRSPAGVGARDRGPGRYGAQPAAPAPRHRRRRTGGGPPPLAGHRRGPVAGRPSPARRSGPPAGAGRRDEHARLVDARHRPALAPGPGRLRRGGGPAPGRGRRGRAGGPDRAGGGPAGRGRRRPGESPGAHPRPGTDQHHGHWHRCRSRRRGDARPRRPRPRSGRLRRPRRGPTGASAAAAPGRCDAAGGHDGRGVRTVRGTVRPRVPSGTGPHRDGDAARPRRTPRATDARHRRRGAGGPPVRRRAARWSGLGAGPGQRPCGRAESYAGGVEPDRGRGRRCRGRLVAPRPGRSGLGGGRRPGRGRGERGRSRGEPASHPGAGQRRREHRWISP